MTAISVLLQRGIIQECILASGLHLINTAFFIFGNFYQKLVALSKWIVIVANFFYQGPLCCHFNQKVLNSYHKGCLNISKYLIIYIRDAWTYVTTQHYDFYSFANILDGSWFCRSTSSAQRISSRLEFLMLMLSLMLTNFNCHRDQILIFFTENWSLDQPISANGTWDMTDFW